MARKMNKTKICRSFFKNTYKLRKRLVYSLLEHHMGGTFGWCSILNRLQGPTGTVKLKQKALFSSKDIPCRCTSSPGLLESIKILPPRRSQWWNHMDQVWNLQTVVEVKTETSSLWGRLVYSRSSIQKYFFQQWCADMCSRWLYHIVHECESQMNLQKSGCNSLFLSEPHCIGSADCGAPSALERSIMCLGLEQLLDYKLAHSNKITKTSYKQALSWTHWT